MFTVVIPACNEEAVIERCLDRLTDAKTRFPHVIVVCNGCTDATAKLARDYSTRIKVLDLEIGSKIGALNAGLSEIRHAPAFFVDADISVGYESLQTCAKHMENNGVLACAPYPLVDLRGVDLLVRMYYQVWCSLPYFTNNLIGSGVYGLSQGGLDRLRSFPDLIADDLYVRNLFHESERSSPVFNSEKDKPTFIIHPPTKLSSLLKIEKRRRIGTRQLEKGLNDTSKSTVSAHRKKLVMLAANPTRWPALLTYLIVKIRANIYANKAMKKCSIYQWSRDETSRSS